MPQYKDKKRNTWGFRVYVEDKKGIKKQKERTGFLTKAIAKEEEYKFLSSYNYSDFNNMTFQELYDIYIMSKRQTLKPQSLRSTISKFENHILPFFKDYLIRLIDNRTYLEWKDFIIKKEFSHKYNSNLHGSMVSILNYAMDFYGLEKNIASKVGNFKKVDVDKKINFWTYEEFSQFITYVDDKLYYTLYSTLYFTGMRLGECLALTWNDYKDTFLDVNKTLAKGRKSNGEYIITSPKTKSSVRYIKLDKHTKCLIDDLYNYYSKFIGFQKSWFIFGGLNAMSQTTIGRKKDEYSLKAKVKKIRIHDLRHSHATFLLSNGVPPTVISKRLGHSTVNTTLTVYSHFIPSDEDKAIMVIDSINCKNEFFIDE